MKKRCLLVLALLAGLAGCTDTVESVTREYRNANNEAIDAMMMVTSEARAGQMTARVFKPSVERYKAIDSRLNIVQNNRLNHDFVVETFESAGLHLYLTELEVNQQRFSLEMIRLRNLTNQEKDAGRECPNLLELLSPSGPLASLRTQLTNPKLPDMMGRFPNLKNVKDYEKLYQVFAKKREGYRLKQDIILAE